MLSQIINTVGKHKIPRYIYHMTNRANYQSMLNDGVIKTTNDVLLGKGVFTTELTNLFKRWRNNSSWGNCSLQDKLIEQVAHGKDDIVILRIPTSKLDSDKLVVRSQNRFFSWCYSDKAEAALDMTEKIRIKLGIENSWLDKAREILIGILTVQEPKSSIAHLTVGAPAKMSSLYKRRKEALEYVYRDNIPLSEVEKIGEVNIAELRKSAEFDPIRPMRSIFTNLLKGTPEVKGAELLNC